MEKSKDIQYKVRAIFINDKRELVRAATDIDEANRMAAVFKKSLSLEDVTISWDGADRIVTEVDGLPLDIMDDWFNEFVIEGL
jgi:hypothetical protein